MSQLCGWGRGIEGVKARQSPAERAVWRVLE